MSSTTMSNYPNSVFWLWHFVKKEPDKPPCLQTIIQETPHDFADVQSMANKLECLGLCLHMCKFKQSAEPDIMAASLILPKWLHKRFSIKTALGQFWLKDVHNSRTTLITLECPQALLKVTTTQ